ncbi:MAG: phosphoribosylaminoimidazolesuccinocarboxamide synthase [Balneolia bacterium]|nr:phosphoribosylaminoimidazolesuccinocarboxamide synthase [Balneolia bacterium]
MSTNNLLQFCINLTSAEGFPEPKRGKVRDIYELNDKTLAIVATDRISSFDHILGEAIPCKGQILNRIAAFSMEKVTDIIDTHIIDIPHPNITIAHKCEPLPVEVVVRGYLTGHAWREYSSGLRILCGESMPDDMKQFDAFPDPILTPTTKANEGHDEDITHKEIVDRKLISKKLWDEVTDVAFKLFKRGTEVAASQGLILADTKYEFGLLDGKLMLIDEVHTPDSSRYFYKESFETFANTGEEPEQLSKEFVREWLKAHNFTGKPGQTLPMLPDSFRIEVFEKYAQLYRVLTGEEFTPVITPEFDHTLSEILKKYV